LLDAVVGQDEIIGSEAENRFAAAGLYQRRHQDEIGAAAQDGGGIGNILCMRPGAAENLEGEEDKQAELPLPHRLGGDMPHRRWVRLLNTGIVAKR